MDDSVLLRAIKKHRDATGHDRCHLNDRELYAAAGLGPADFTLPPRGEFLKVCAAYLAAQTGVPEAFAESTEVTQLRERVAEWEQSFELFHAAVRRGDKLWQDRHPNGHPHVLPDTGQLVAWLTHLVGAAEDAVELLGEDLLEAGLIRKGAPDAVQSPGAPVGEAPAGPADAGTTAAVRGTVQDSTATPER